MKPARMTQEQFDALDKGEREHVERFEALAQKYGVAALVALVPVSKERVEAALACGDKHLNGIMLSMWDKAALTGMGPIYEPCPTCKHPREVTATYRDATWHGNDWPLQHLKSSARVEPWNRYPQASLSDRVCVLKHVAKYHL